MRVKRLLIWRLLPGLLFAAALIALGYVLVREMQPDGELQVTQEPDGSEPSQTAHVELNPGLPVYVRIFKQESELELWMNKDGKWAKFRTFKICRWSGRLGPKLKEGDRQSPEGFYEVGLTSLNPNSSYHLSFNLGFPNAYDRSHGRTGSYLMVHGECASIGCYAMTNPGIEVIYRLVEAALRNGQDRVPVHIFPFRMSEDKLKSHAGSAWAEFWHSLKPAYDYFETNRKVPAISVRNKSYVVNAAG